MIGESKRRTICMILVFLAMMVLMVGVWSRGAAHDAELAAWAVPCDPCGGTGRRTYDVVGSNLTGEVAPCIYCRGAEIHRREAGED